MCRIGALFVCCSQRRSHIYPNIILIIIIITMNLFYSPSVCTINSLGFASGHTFIPKRYTPGVPTLRRQLHDKPFRGHEYNVVAF
ncbi:hypothetical protein FKM82_015444 [Ascaphus truei]